MHGNKAASPDRAIAVVGAACRLPGGIHDLDGLWDALVEGRDVVGEVPADRFESRRFADTSMPRTGKSYTVAGGFLEDIASFDAAYFGIAPKEAAQMDPQHRLLMELAVEALDDAGIAAERLAGSDTAVYVGVSDTSYGALQLMMPEAVNAYTMSGGASSIAANRLSHFFDLHGPSMAVDTACSSSLVALDRACRTLLDGSSRVALSAGVNALLSPYHYVGFSQAAMLSPTGRCASFSAHADGFVRAEGGGVVVLKKLVDAVADGDRIHGVILGTASNSDGRTMGLALPNADAQEDLLRSVYAQAGVAPDELVYLEAHGTGTLVGDPLECRAIGLALGRRRAGGVLPIGSVKTNVGHLEPASGMAGLLKALLVLRHGTIPPSLHACPPHPDIDFAGLNLTPVTRCRPVGAVDRPVVGVNSFGFGGSNAHAILTSSPALPPARREGSGGQEAPGHAEACPVIVSARTPEALTEAASLLADRLATATPREFYDIAYTTCRRRGLHPHRAAVLAGPRGAARWLRGLAGPRAGTGEASDALPTPDAPPASDAPTGAGEPEQSAFIPLPRDDEERARPVGTTAQAVREGRIAFAFSGNGSQWAGMAADLLASSAAFREAVAAVDAALAPLLGWSVAGELAGPADQARLAATEIAQPLLFAVQVGVVRMLAEQGVTPHSVLGHSVGEVAAAHVAGALDLRQAAQVIAERSRTQAATAGSGRMAAVALPPAEAEEAMAAFPGLELAAVNSGRDVTVAGPSDQLKLYTDELTQRDVGCKELGLDYAFHSAAMDPVEEPLRQGLAGLRPAATRLAMFSTVTGGRIEGTGLGADYWWRNVREPVRFAPAVEQAIDDGADVFVEIGPHPVLRSYLRRIANSRPRAVIAVTATLRRGADGPDAMHQAVTTLMAEGAQVDWSVYFPRQGRVARLPAYPWQRERHWNGTPQTWLRTSGSGHLDHPLLGERLPSPVPTWQGAVEPALAPWLADHKLAGSVVVPATAYVEMALAAGRHALDETVEVDCLEITRPLVVPWAADAGSVRVQLAVTPDDGLVSITSTDGQSPRPRQHVRARVRALLGRPPADLDVPGVRARCPRLVGGAEHYDTVGRAGLQYGPAFQVLRELHVGNGEVLAAYRHRAPGDEYTAHPALLDGALQAGAPLLGEAVADGAVYLPAAVGAARVWRTPATAGWIHVRQRALSADEACWDIVVTDHEGTVGVELRGCRLRRLAGAHHTPLITHHTELRALPGAGEPVQGEPPAAPAGIAAGAAGRIAALRADWHEHDYAGFVALLKEAAAHRHAAALAALLPDVTAPFEVADLIAVGMDPRRRPYLACMIPELVRHGLLEQDSGRLRLTRPAFDDRELLRRLTLEFPQASVESRLAISTLREVLTSDGRDPLEVLVSGGSLAELEQLYDTAFILRFHNRVAQALLRETVRRWPADRPLRVLEVGAGTGGMAAALLPLLPSERAQYVYTDVSAAFLARAERRFAAYDFVTYRPFDLDADPLAQGLPEAGFDLVIAANALHTARHLESAVRHLGTLLAPGGLLLGIESHDPHVLAPYFGALDSFWDRTDHEERPDSPLLPADRWPALLERCGFTDVVRTGDDAAPCRDDFSVLLAAAPRRVVVPPPLPSPRPGRRWVIAAETAAELGFARALAALVPPPDDDGGTTVRMLAEGPADWAAEFGEDGADVCVILGEAAGPEPARAVARATGRAALMRAVTAACARLADGVRASLTMVTRPSGALPRPERALAPQDAAVWGVARTLANEEPRLSVRMISLDRDGETVTGARRVARELLSDDAEAEVVLTAGGGRFVPRELALPAAGPAVAASPAADSFALDVRSPGLSYQLAWVEHAPVPAGPGQVAVAVRAAALNYRDMMQAVGLLPAEAVEGTYSAVGLGLECAGVVTSVGPDVTGFRPGDRVYGLAPAALASHTVTAHQALAHIPEGMGFAEAATLPVAFSTVHYSLDQLARLRAGETVLVHGGAGGVGLAVLQYARMRGARVIATAGTAAKRELLRHLDVDHVLDSRSLEFAPGVMAATGGEGVDVIVNSLAGEAITRGLELLRPGGRFIELGKRDIYENKPLLLRPFRNNIAFFGVDLTALAFDPVHGAALFAAVAARVREGAYRPLPHSVYPAARVAEAFQLLQHSRHSGKVVIAFDPLDEPVPVERRGRAPRLDAEGTYLVTGGLGGFGAATAGWLAERGVRHLALVSRRGEQAPEAPAVLAGLAARGVQATAYAADAADLAAMRRVIEEIDAGGHPLRGVVHCAMQLEDDLLTELTDERFAAALSPKAGGAMVLDQLLDGRELEMFLMYSSGTTTFGNIRQTNYVAANLWLEALARHRRGRGAAGQAIAWGAIGETGYVARNELTRILASAGIEPVSLREAFTAAGLLTGSDLDVAGAGRYNWGHLRRLLPALAAPRCATLLPENMAEADYTREEILRALAAMSVEDATRAIADTLARLLADVLHLDHTELDHHRRLDEYGLDSLMIAELLVSVRGRFDIDIPPMELLRSGGTITDIAQLVLLRLGLSGPSGTAAGGGTAASEAAAGPSKDLVSPLG
ncbi:polyketide synthase [Streptomyces sp. NBRC 110611]|uniref:type I polyketide synthase n=1 Tax=Streptomyces sp. NBRC 110611 TaxID=1621259 RepID=UPI00082E23C5|nr:type I polyketide synthase [Streptomyces sp. NBRC 110611]GAU70877.1 polyketide synthase [Streptomyces sp. NBRC 110611]